MVRIPRMCAICAVSRPGNTPIRRPILIWESADR
ncbi:hypothetical protein ABIA35_001686 [Catenulispora sp. MAP12-49]